MFKSLSGYNHTQQRMRVDWDRTPIVLYGLNEPIDIEYYTQEFQFNGLNFNDRLKWVSGLFYFRDKAKDDRYRISPLDGVDALEFKHLTTTSYAVFGQGTYNFTDRFSATIGLRWSHDEKDFTGFRVSRNFVNGVPRPFKAPKGEWDSVSPRLGLEQRWTPDLMTYVSAAKGFKAGGMNDVLTSTICPDQYCGLTEFKDENLWTYEVGIRSEFFDHRVRLNLTAFYTDYQDMQVQITDSGPPPAQYTINADSTVQGLELDVMAAVTDRLTLRGSYGYTKSEYGSNILAQTLAPGGGKSTLSQQTPLLRSPKTSYAMAATYKQPLANDADLVFDINWGWKAEQASTSTPTNMVILPAYGLLNGRLEFRSAENWSVAAFGNNLLNKYYLTSAFDPGGPSTKPIFGSQEVHDTVFGFTIFDVGRPRELGIEVGYKF